MPEFPSRNPDFRAAVERYVSAQSYLALIGVTLNRVEPGLAEYRLPYRDDIGQQNGFFHGGVIGGIAEGSMGAAAFTLVAAGANVVGAEYKVNLLAPGRGPALLARYGRQARPQTDRLPGRCSGARRGRLGGAGRDRPGRHGGGRAAAPSRSLSAGRGRDPRPGEEEGVWHPAGRLANGARSPTSCESLARRWRMTRMSTRRQIWAGGLALWSPCSPPVRRGTHGGAHHGGGTSRLGQLRRRAADYRDGPNRKGSLRQPARRDRGRGRRKALGRCSAPVSRMQARGASAEVVTVGKNISVFGYPSREKPNEMRAERITVDDRTARCADQAGRPAGGLPDRRALAVAGALAAGAAMRSSPLLYPAVNVAHILGLMLFFAAVALRTREFSARLRNSQPAAS